ncbi:MULTISPECIES: homoserine kinase [unclassified Sedimentibacter]|uniref:homoserine kinase n=1 Tax=unclassified Sedimentibacter TaxID=2649220 RepID=UPI0027DFF4E9|nr:homoserine kinase [Sedimentibacter sp. MB35-C1]WMJ76645.1 homoserine kinase [Sedimentibacter sp. MB35-C1]
MIKVTVPATTANMGPGFDTLGLALNMYNIYRFEEINEGLIIEGCPEKYINEDNLVYKSFMIAAEEIGRTVKGLKVSMNTNIPVSRGLGSSSACIVGGVFGANALLKGGLSKDELFKIAVNIEGHPDNIAPAVYGGLTASIMDGGTPFSMHYNISEKLKFCAVIPDFETSTCEARKLLPKDVPFQDAIFNVSRTAVLLKALEEGNIDVINVALKDVLHQKYRKAMIHEFEDVEKICRENGSSAFFISGSGPTLMNIIVNSDFTNAIKHSIMNLKYNWEIKYLSADKEGVIIEY